MKTIDDSETPSRLTRLRVGLRRWGEDVNIRVLVGLSLVFALLILALLLNIGSLLYGGGEPTDRWIGFSGAIALLVGSLGGLAQAWRRESLGPLGGSISGNVAATIGWVWAAVCWIGALALVCL